MTLDERVARLRIRRVPHPDTEKVPPRYVVHLSTRGNGRWEMHEKDSPYCAVTHPGWTGDPECGCLGTSYPPGRESWARAVAEATARACAARRDFKVRMQMRGKVFS